MTNFEDNKDLSQQVEARAGAMLENVLNGMEALICVCDSETFEILFLNDQIRKNFGIEESGVGKLCYKVLQKLDKPCASCPHKQLLEQPDVVLTWEHTERIKGSVLRKTARLIDWTDGKKGHLEYAIDITELKKTKEALENQNALLYAVNYISGMMLKSHDVTFAMDLVDSMGVIGKAMKVDRVYIWEDRMKEENLAYNQIYEWTAESESQPGSESAKEIFYRHGITEWKSALSQGQCINGLVKDMEPVLRELLTRQGVISILVIPIFFNDTFWGLVGFDNCHSERIFSDSEEKILHSASELLANAFIRNNMEKNIHFLETEVDKIYYDPLTGIYNRRYFDENLKSTILSLARTHSMLSVLMVDIDHFKKYNDTYGHTEGDRCLKTVAEALAENATRTDDFVARYGGEEFVIVLPNTDAKGASKVAVRLLEGMQKCAIPHEKNSAADYVTVSVGIATGKAHRLLSNDDFIRCADAMLYKSKREGRNRFNADVLP